jgi:hypothetical protein
VDRGGTMVSPLHEAIICVGHKTHIRLFRRGPMELVSLSCVVNNGWGVIMTTIITFIIIEQ